MYKNMYYPKRPVKSFQDLEVYQKALGVSAVIVKRITEDFAVVKTTSDVVKTGDQNSLISEKRQTIARRLIDRALSLSYLIAYAHSVRFTPGTQALDKLEETMLNSNLTIVSLEQYRDICNNGIEVEFFDEQIKNLHLIRHKVLYLQRSWKKFMENNKREGNYEK